MLIEDGREHVEKALRALMKRKGELGLEKLRLRSLEKFEEEITRVRLRPEERETIVEQAIVLIEQLYAHLPFKRTRYAINPVQRLRLLRHRSTAMTDREFHAEMLETFNELRDAHTFYSLPKPYRGSIAFLPFLMTSFFDEGKVKYVVTRVLEYFGESPFSRGSEITLWNGMPVGLAVHRLADRTPAGNDAAREARGLAHMTMRPLAFTLPPDERVVYLQYKPMYSKATEEQAIALPWSVGTGLDGQLFNSSVESTSICSPLAESDIARQALWYHDRQKRCLQIEQKYRSSGRAGRGSKASTPPPDSKKGESDLGRVSRLPRNFEFQHSGGEGETGVRPEWLRDARRKNRRIAYIRIRSFLVPENLPEDDFVEEFGRILDLMRDVAPEGLILDIRGNPGGSIKAADRILQFLTPKDVRPAMFHFTITSLIQEIAMEIKQGGVAVQNTTAELRPWIQDIMESVVSGDVITGGRPLTPTGLANDTGQRYQGPITLIVDARVYSAAEIFAGGFEDHEIGDIIGVSESTGGGGANRWLHKDLISRLSEIKGLPLAPLPGGATLTKLPGGAQLALAFRRSSRVHKNTGYAIEDVGVKVRDGFVHRPTKADFEESDRDLLRFAVGILGKRPVYSLNIERAVIRNGVADVEVTTRNMDRLECFVDLHPQCAVAVSPKGDSRKKIRVPLDGLPGRGRRQLMIQGYARGGPDGKRALVASARARMETARK